MTSKAVIVDEVFDGNRPDLEIVRIAAEARIPTMVIGDPWQALYEFRGAQPELVPGFVDALQFETFPISGSFRFVARLLPRRRPRANPRVVKRKYTRWHVKRSRHRDWPQPVRTPDQAIRVAN